MRSIVFVFPSPKSRVKEFRSPTCPVEPVTSRIWARPPAWTSTRAPIAERFAPDFPLPRRSMAMPRECMPRVSVIWVQLPCDRVEGVVRSGR